jgi:hypothetical protein
MPDRTCSIEGCGRGGKITRGWCNRHYLSWCRHGDPLVASAPKAPKACDLEDCAKKFYAKGLCQMHYMRLRETGRLDRRPLLTDDEKRANRRDQAHRRAERMKSLGVTCSESFCPKLPAASGLCAKHYARRCKWGTTSGHAPLRPLDTVPFTYAAPARCSADTCTDVVHAEGYCRTHYYRRRKHGDTAPRPRRRVAPLPHSAGAGERFWHRVDKAGPVPNERPRLGPCWLWLGGLTSDGYGLFRPKKGQQASAHRFAWSALGLPLIQGLTLDHLCRRRDCVRPSHLEQVTHAENIARSNSICTANGAKTHCKDGHLFDECNTLTPRRGARGCRTCYNVWRRRRRATLRLSRVDQAVAKSYKAAIASDRCRYCGGIGEQNDHYFPVAKGGGGQWLNLTRSCRKCNQTKGAFCGTWFILRNGAARAS